MKLFDACYSCIGDSVCLAVFRQCEIYLAGAVDYSFDVGGIEGRILVSWIRED